MVNHNLALILQQKVTIDDIPIKLYEGGGRVCIKMNKHKKVPKFHCLILKIVHSAIYMYRFTLSYVKLNAVTVDVLLVTVNYIVEYFDTSK